MEFNNTFLQSSKRSDYSAQMPMKNTPYQIYPVATSNVYSIYFSEAFVEPNQYTDVYHLLRTMTEFDTLHMYLNSEGGHLHTGMQLIKCMRECNGKIITHLDGQAMSLTPLILLNGDSIEVTEHSIIMFHDFSGGNIGKGSEMSFNIDAYRVLYREMIQDYAIPFLTQEEVDHMLDGKDYYFNSDEIEERLTIMSEKCKEQHDQMVADKANVTQEEGTEV